ncbi:MAG TPA: hypothetical protein VND20_00415 [Candidatus Binataceae bacterium]|nr:hypothetical protein [Candidatus Binataceae bacterium]
MAARVLTKDLDSRLKALEDRIGEVAAALERIAEHRRPAEELTAAAASSVAVAASDESAANDKLSRLEAIVCRLDDRVEKITQTIVTQTSRWA